MRKRLVLFSILICSIFCIFGCNKDPYKNMSLELVGGKTEVQLNIEEVMDNGQTIYNYDSYSFDVQVKNVGNDISKMIAVSGGEDIVDYSMSYIGNGLTRVNISPKSNEKTGKFKLTVKTLEGNKSLTLDFQVDLKINNFTINEDNLKVIAKGQSIDLRAVEKYINFFPAETTQKNIEFSVVVPNVVSPDDDRAEIEGHPEQTYVYKGNGTYASIENGVLKTYKNVEYPKMIDTVVVGGNENQEIYTTCITLKATSKDLTIYGENGEVVSQKIPDRYIDVVVIEDCDNVSLKMNCQKNDGLIGEIDESNSFALEKNKDGEYDVTLINPNYRNGVQYDTYYIERDLIFDFGEISEDGSYKPNDYYVSTSPVEESDDKPIALSFSALDNSFKVQAQKAGEYKHVFKVDNIHFPKIIDKEIVVNFHVLDIPTSIKINDSAVKDGYKIYKNYGNSWGTRFTVSLSNSNGFNYFVFLKDESLNGNLKFYKADGTEQVFALCKEEGGEQVISSTKEGVGYSNFKSNETFYLRHNFENLPGENYQIFIGVIYDVASSSYSDEVKQNYFVKSLIEFPINLSFEIGLQSLDFTKDKYVIDLTNSKYNNGELDADGIKLLEVPAGQSLESVISLDSIVYDNSLITVYPVFDDLENKVSLYVKCNSEFKVGKTDLTITSKNGLKKSVSVSTFIPTMYAENLNLSEENQMPISIGFSSDEVLYYFSSQDNGDPHKKFEIYKTIEGGQQTWGEFEYDSLNRLILLKDSNIDLRFYDYLLTENDGKKYCTPIDITENVQVSFSDPGFAVYSNGRLSVSKVTMDIINPVIMTVTYTGGYIQLNDMGEEEYKTYTIEQRIQLYIYLPLQGVTITTPKTVDLYVDESLGIYSKDLSKHTIISDFIPNEVQLGAGWNNIWFNASIPVNLSYDFEEVLNSPIYLSDGSQLYAIPAKGNPKPLVYGDLFAPIDGVDNEYTCPIHCKISQNLLDWIKYDSGYGEENIDWVLKNRIFNNNITMVVNVYITQFSKLQNINSVKITAKYASKISSFDLDVADDGVYFEKRENDQNEMKATISYSIDATDAVNKNILISSSDNIVFSAEVTQGANGTSGTIQIKGNNAGIKYLTAVPEDNIKSYDKDTKTYTYYDNKLVKTFRVKVADGSAEYPFEINSVEKYVAMQDDVSAGNYYNYILTRNINLAEIANPRINFAPLDSGNESAFNDFRLNGMHSYYKDDVEYTQFSKLTNLYIKEKISASSDINIGLFENINSKVTLRNISLINAKIDLEVSALNEKNLNVGLLAGLSNGAKIYDTYCVGSIRIVNSSQENNISTINVGGMIGVSKSTVINGLPGIYTNGFSNDAYNTNVNIDYSQMQNKNALSYHRFNVGGLVGYDRSSTFNNVQVLSTIVGTNYNSSVGGVIGKSYVSQLNQVVVYPNIKITDAETNTSNVINVSNMIGSGGDDESPTYNIKIENSKVYFVKEEYKNWQLNLSTRVESESTINFGGLIGNLNNNNAEIRYSYIRSFYAEEVPDEYYANIYIDAENGGNIGGLVGTPNSSKLIISNSYFDADILVAGEKIDEVLHLKANTNLGMIVGNATNFASNSIIANSYAIGNINVIYLGESGNTIIEKQRGVSEFTALLGGITLEDGGSSDLPSQIRVSTTATIKRKEIANLTISNVYGVVNTNNYYFGLSGKLIGLYETNKVLLGTNGILLKSDDSHYLEEECGDLFGVIGFALVIDSAGASATDEQWIWNANANKVQGIAFPILLNNAKTKALYDLIPERIIVDRVASNINGLYDVSYEETIDSITIKHIQLIMFVNSNDTKNQNNYYDVVVDSKKSSISLKFDGETIISSFLEINSDIVLSEDSLGKVISLVGSKIYPVGEGLATLTVRSALDKTVKLEMHIKVISGITRIDLNSENSSHISEVYIDEVSNFKLNNINEIGGIRYNSSNYYGYQVDILDYSDLGKNGKISINGKELVYNSVDESKNTFIFNTNSLVIKGIDTGIVKFKITPIVYIDEFKHVPNCNYKVLDNINNSNEYLISVCARAKSINVDKEEIKIAPKNTTNFNVTVETSNVIINEISDGGDPETITYKIGLLSALHLKIGTKNYSINFSTKEGENVVPVKYNATKLSDGSFDIPDFIHEIDFEIIRLRIQGIKIYPTNFDSEGNKNTYNVVFNIAVVFNSNYYRANADDFDLNTIIYTLTFSPESNKEIDDSVKIGISPNVLSEIFTNYYSRGELLVNSDNEVFPKENESNFVVPGTNGLLKITLDEEYSDSSYITVTLDKTYQEYVSLNQMAGVINTTIIIDGDVTDYIDSYTNIRFKQTVDTDNEYGIRLSKLTLNYSNQNYFSRTYFVKLGLIRNYGNLETINLKITSYKIENGIAISQLSKIVTLNITELPLIDVKVDNESSAVIGKGIMKPLEITHRGISNDIEFGFNEIIVVDGETKTELYNDGKVYIAYENVEYEDGQEVTKLIKVTTLSIEDLKANKKYYLCADVSADLKTLEVYFKVEEMVLGVRENAKSNLRIQVVDFEIESIKIDSAIDGVVTLKHGQNLILNTIIDYKKPTVGNVEEYIEELEKEWGSLKMAEYSAAGITIFKNNIVQNNATLRLGYGEQKEDRREYSPMEVGKYYNFVELKEDRLTRGEYELHYYIISGTGITKDSSVKLRLSIPYAYVEGSLTIDEIMGFDTYEVDFDVIVEDSSSYDKPNPIENQDDLITACNAQGGDYILLNNIELENWTPIDATFASLDGNGYVIKLKSFNLTSARNQDSVDIGIFATTNEGTLLKNITVDVSQMLVTESEMLDRLDKVASSSEDSYVYDDTNIDVSFVKNVNCGILVGTNNGSITNAKIINTRPTSSSTGSMMYFHVVTTQGYLENTLVSTKIGGIAGANGEKGAITNSFVGLNKSTMENNVSYVQIVNNPSETQYNNETDELESIAVYPFVLAGGNNLAGMVGENSGIISNSYVKALGLYNTFPAVKDSKTAGFVATNNGTITSCFVESKNIAKYRAVEDMFKIESTGNIGGFVYLNTSLIENAYSNVYLETQSAFTGGFVFNNDTAGKISNSYTTTVNTNNIARGQFTGVGDNARDVLNSGTYYNCFYLVLGNESVNDNEYATAMISDNPDISDKNAWRGFSFTTEANSEGVWVLKDNATPEIASSIIDTNSFRQLSGKETIQDGDISYEVYSYQFIGYTLGSKNNPLIIDKASNFATYIIDNAVEIDNQHIFGISQNSHSNIFSDMNVVRYVRIVNNLDFEKITSSTMHKGTYLYKLIFAGVLDGNGMSLKNLNINTETIQLDNFGLFAQVGVESNISTNPTVIKNINLDVRTYKSSDSSRAGILAGTIVNSNIINVKINGNSTDQNSAIVIGGRNMAGALAGLIYADEYGTISLYDIEVKNVTVEASFGSLGGEITEDSVDMSYGFYNKFKIRNVETQMEIQKSFVSLYNKITNKTELFDKNSTKIRTDVSYTGAIAGVILANNYSVNVGTASNIDNYRTSPDSNTIDNLIVKGSITIRTADNSGGLFGYIGENTLIKNSKFILGENQIINAFNFAGGIVAENHGVIEQCSVALEDALQETYDNNIIDKTSEQKNNYQLFDKLYTVSIGGIAGYSNNGVIIDSYSKINVIKLQAYIAGGIIGYSENYNYIGYTYYSGAIYSKFITGGLVGLQANADKNGESGADINGYLVLNNAYSLVDWNYTTDDYDFRQKNIEKLYENQKVMYTKPDGTYYRFYVKMPEIGNLNVSADSDKISSYSSLHNSFYLGSAVGYVIMNTMPNSSGVYQYPDSDARRLLTSDDIDNYKLKASSNVVTNTLGLYSTSGSLASGNKVDNYFSSVFNYYIDNTNYINLYSLRVAYNTSSLNSYELKAIDEAKPDDYFDIFTYPKVYNQEYTEQMLGTYSIVADNKNKTTANIFRFKYIESERYDKESSDSTFICMKNDHIWAMSKYLPKFSYGMYTSGKTITNKVELTEALTTFSSGKVYKIVPPSSAEYSIELDTISAVNKNIAYTQTIKDVYMGVTDGSGKKPKIVINVNGTNEQIENLSTVNSIFNILSGVTFSNIDFEIKYGKNVNLQADKIYSNFGFFANTLQNATISNCSFTLNFEKDISFEKGVWDNSTFNCNNIGLMFGSINNSTITNSTFAIQVKNAIQAKNIVLVDEKISNFGLFAGIIENSAITNNTFNITTSGVTISNSNTSLNVGGIAGVLNYSTYRDNEADIIDNDTNKKLIINNEKGLNQLNIATLFGFANNANISDIELSKNLNVTNKAKVNELNVAYVVAMSNACNISKASTAGELNVSEETGSEIQIINVGAIIGNNLKSSTLGDEIVKSTANINVAINSMNMSVGGLVGLSGNATNLITLGQCDGEINVTNESEGKTTYDEKGNEVITLANISVGGLLGKSQGIVGLSNVLSTAKITMKQTATKLVKVAVGGIIGASNLNTELNSFSSLATITFEISNSYETNCEVYVSGVIGLNKGIFVGNNGFVLVELPKISNALTTAVTNGSISRTTQNVFYCQELLRNYDYDCNFDTFALADLYNESLIDSSSDKSLSEYCKLGQIVVSKENSFFATDNTKSNGNLVVFVPKGTSIDDSELDNAIYTPNLISSGITSVTQNSYNVILDNVNMSGVTINDGAIVSGRTLATGNVEISMTKEHGDTVTEYAISINNGILSNVYFKTTSDENSAQNIALVGTNNGLVTNVYAYGLTEAQYAIANTNNGQIYKSVSVTIYESGAKSIYGLVYSNTQDGIISDCYSSSFAHILNTIEKVKVYGLAQTNLGKIQYSFYYIPEIMDYENEVQGYAEITSSGEGESKVQGNTFRCEMSTMPTFVESRNTIWTKENDHGQIIGLKDIEGAIVIKLKMNTESGVTYDLNEMKGYLRQKDNSKTYTFGYEINFYSKEKLDYHILRFNNGDKFANYINALQYTSIPSDTIIILDGKLSIKGDIKAFSIPASSMLIGINNCVVDYVGSNYITHEIIKTNIGIIANITFTDFNFNYTNDTDRFAPIMYNYGTIYKVLFMGDSNLTIIKGGESTYVAGLVSINGVDGVLNKCGINKLTIYSAVYYNFICNNSYGKVYGCTATNYSGIGSLYPSGKNGINDNDL